MKRINLQCKNCKNGKRILSTKDGILMCEKRGILVYRETPVCEFFYKPVHLKK